MPDFTVRGNPGAIRSRATLTSEKGTLFDDTGAALAKIDTAGWTGRAADNFRDAHDLEPDRWYRAGNGFRRAGSALLAYADAVEQAQATAEWARGEYERGEGETASYRSWFDSETSRLRGGLADGTYSSITLPVWDDPGAELRSNALAELEQARAALDNAAHVCAGEVRAGCADAPEEPAWWESGLKFVGGIFQGAGEALWDLATMLPFSPANLIQDAWKLATGDLTPEELAKTYELDLETVQGMWDALRDDPVEFGKNLGKGLLDWDTWADDPARAIGHLVPDAVAAVATGGAATAATRGAGALDDVADGMRAIDRMGDAADLRHLDDLNRFDGPPAGMHQWDPDTGYRSLDDQLRDPSFSASNRDIVDGDYDVLGGRGTPEEFVDDFRVETGDPRFPVDWDWEGAAPNDGRVAGSERFLEPGEIPEIDRIGSPAGSYFGRDGDPMSARSLPPDRLNFERTSWQVDADHPSLRDGTVRIEESSVAPAFGQQGGGTQYRFMEGETPLTQGQLAKDGIITPMDELRTSAPTPPGAAGAEGWFDPSAGAAGAGGVHGLESLDRFLDDYLPQEER